MQVQDIKKEIEAATRDIKKEIMDMVTSDEIADLNYCLESVREFAEALRIFNQKIKTAYPSVLNTEEIRTELINLITGINAKASRLSSLDRSLRVSKDEKTRILLERMKQWSAAEIMQIMPEICGAARTQSWSLGMTFGLLPIIVTFGPR